MKSFLYLVVLLSCSCSRGPVVGPVDPIFSTPTSLALDSAGHVTPDSVHAVTGPKTVVVGGKKIKLKRGATLVIQQGQGNTATVVGKPKNSVLATGAGAVATDNTQAQGSVAVGPNAQASGSPVTREAGWPWYVWAALAGGLVYGLYRLIKWLGL